MGVPVYVPPHLRRRPEASITLRRLGKACIPDIEGGRARNIRAAKRPADRLSLVNGPHMNDQGGSWSRPSLEYKTRIADQDWARHDATGVSDGYYWVAYRDGKRGPIAIVGMHRAPEDSAYTFRAYFGAAVVRSEEVAVIMAALNAFARLRPEQAFVWTRFRGTRISPNCSYLLAGFRVIGVARCNGKTGRQRPRDVGILSRALSPPRCDANPTTLVTHVPVPIHVTPFPTATTATEPVMPVPRQPQSTVAPPTPLPSAEDGRDDAEYHLGKDLLEALN